MQINKIKTYFNLLKRCNKIIYGFDNIRLYNKKAYLIIFADTILYEHKLIDKANQLNCKLFCTNQDTLNNLLDTDNCKVVLIKNNELANAILKENQNINLLREVNLFESNTKQ